MKANILLAAALPILLLGCTGGRTTAPYRAATAEMRGTAGK